MIYKAISIVLLIAAIGFGQTEIVFFNESVGSSVYYDPSWGYKTTPSSLELINSNKFPVETGHVYLGSHALRLHWTSVSGGDWGIAVASPGWTAYDLTEFDSLTFMVNSPASVNSNVLPALALEDINNHKSSRVALSLYSPAVDSDEASWQKFTVPLSAFTPGGEHCDFTKIKTIFFFQDSSDNANHALYLDEIKVIGSGSGNPDAPVPQNLTAKGCDSRIDLKWRMIDSQDISGFHVYRSESLAGPYNRITSSVSNFSVYSDFTGANDQTWYYFVRTVSSDYSESFPSDTVSASTYQMTDEELLTSVQEATFRYFYDYGHPVSGLARERSNGYAETCASGGAGMGLITMIVGSERGFEAHDSVAARVLKILTFLEDKTTRYHGAWPHWINGRTGATIPFSTYDNGGDLVETAYLVQGILTVRQYFKADNPVENEIRDRATRLWEAVEWDWYLRYVNGTVLFWHWSPNYGWNMNIEIRGYTEAMITYLLAAASPTHPISAQAYHSGWAQNGAWPYINGKTLFGYKQWVGWDYGGPLFFTHYSFLGFDPRNKADKYCNYFNNNRNISLINRAYCIDNPRNHTGYSSLVWGLTASDDPWGYQAHEPNYSDRDNGTITPTAALSAMAYIPEESIATLKHFYFTYGAQLWGPFGFRDAFHPGEQWFSESYLAIDQGTIVPMMENYRSGLCWNAFMANPEISPMLVKLGFTTTNISDEPIAGIDRSFIIRQAWPNPFNSRTQIELTVHGEMRITAELYDAAGRKFQTLFSNKSFPAGNHTINIQGDMLASGIYLIRLSSSEMSKTLKVVLIK
jgi:hypothetical protein